MTGRTLEGCSIGALVCDCVDGHLVDAIETALNRNGASLTLIAPAADRILTAEGDLIPADRTLDRHPAADFDALILLLSPEGAKALIHAPAAVDFLHDAHEHRRPIAFFPDASPLVSGCGLDDDGEQVVEIADARAMSRFLEDRGCRHGQACA